MKKNRYLIALVAALGLIPIVLDTTIVTVALTPIRNDLQTDVNTVQWIVTGFFLANAAVVAVGGYLANRFGRKRMFLLGIGVFTLGSVLCGISPNIEWLIAFRVLQGIGGGMLLPIGPALAFDAFPQEERARASAVVAVPILLAPVFGPILGGWLNDTFVWHSLFFVNLPVGVLALAAAFLVLPNDQPGEARRVGFDSIGLALSTLGIIAVVYAFKLVTQTNPDTVTATNPAGAVFGWGYWLVWVLLGAGALVLGIFAFYALRISRDPALDLRQFGRRDFLLGSLFTWATAIISFGLLVLLPLYFESVRLPHLSALDTGLALVPLGLGALLGTVISAALYRALGPRWTILLASVVMVVSAWLLAQTIQPTATASQLVAAVQLGKAIPSVASADDLRWGMFLVGLGFAMVNVPVQTLAVEVLKGEALAKASSLFLSTKFIFSSIGVAIITTIFLDRGQHQGTDLASQVQALLPGSGLNLGDPKVVAALRVVEMQQLPVQAATGAIQSIFWLIFWGSIALVVLALLLPGRKPRAAEAEAKEAEPVAAPI
jgi:DHA2 family multidrug resistance protein